MNKLDFGKELIKKRESRGLTQSEVAEKCNITARTIQRIESGSVTPRSSTIKIISETLEIDFFENSNQSSNLKSHKIIWFLKDLFNFKTNAMKKISILSSSILILIFICINIFNTEAQSTTPLKKQEKISGENIGKTDSFESFDTIKIEGNFAWVTKNNKHGIMALDKTIIIPCEYDNLKVDGSYVLTIKGNKRGIMNLDGETIIPCEYNAFEVDGNYVLTLKGNKRGIMNLDGETIIPCEYNAFDVDGNYVLTLKGNKRGIMNLDGETIVPCEYDNFEVESGYVLTVKGSKRGLINLDGETIIPCEYDTLKINKSTAVVTKNGKTIFIKI